MAFNFALHVCLHAQHLLVVVFGEVILAENSVEVYIAVVREGVGAFGWGRRGLGGGSFLLGVRTARGETEAYAEGKRHCRNSEKIFFHYY